MDTAAVQRFPLRNAASKEVRRRSMGVTLRRHAVDKVISDNSLRLGLLLGDGLGIAL